MSRPRDLTCPPGGPLHSTNSGYALRIESHCGIQRPSFSMSDSSPPSSQRIPTRNRRQAMDWSLVLTSQGIEHIIESDEATGWTLAVSAQDHEAALATIRQYRLENLHWRW